MDVHVVHVPAVAGIDLTVALLGLGALLGLICLGVVLSRHYAARREHDLHLDLQEQRQDIERREQRLAERESRLDEELGTLRAQQEQLSAADEERRRALEQVAAMTSEDARQELLTAV